MPVCEASARKCEEVALALSRATLLARPQRHGDSAGARTGTSHLTSLLVNRQEEEPLDKSATIPGFSVAKAMAAAGLVDAKSSIGRTDDQSAWLPIAHGSGAQSEMAQICWPRRLGGFLCGWSCVLAP